MIALYTYRELPAMAIGSPPGMLPAVRAGSVLCLVCAGDVPVRAACHERPQHALPAHTGTLLSPGVHERLQLFWPQQLWMGVGRGAFKVLLAIK